MRVLIDTNAIISNMQKSRGDHAAVGATLRELVLRAHEPCICAQIVHEFWVVATRPADGNGLGLEPQQAANEIDRLLAAFTLISEPADMLTRWRAFCVNNSVRGKRAHDARIATLMIASGVLSIVTNNVSDFQGWPDVRTIVPVAE